MCSCTSAFVGTPVSYFLTCAGRPAQHCNPCSYCVDTQINAGCRPAVTRWLYRTTSYRFRHRFPLKSDTIFASTPSSPLAPLSSHQQQNHLARSSLTTLACSLVQPAGLLIAPDTPLYMKSSARYSGDTHLLISQSAKPSYSLHFPALPLDVVASACIFHNILSFFCGWC